jgi:hypothetical protein
VQAGGDVDEPVPEDDSHSPDDDFLTTDTTNYGCVKVLTKQVFH